MTVVITASERALLDGHAHWAESASPQRLVIAPRREGADPVRKGRPWSLSLEDRVLLVTAYWPTNLPVRQLAALYGSPVGRRPHHQSPRTVARPPAAQAVPKGHRADRGRHPGPHPCSRCGRAVEELPILHRPTRRPSTPTPGASSRSAGNFPVIATTARHQFPVRRTASARPR